MAPGARSAGKRFERARRADALSSAGRRGAAHGLEDISEAFFREGWHINNSREVRARTRRVGLQEVITESDLFTPEQLDRDAFQREFLDRFGLRWFSSFGAIHFDQISPVILTMERPAKLDPFSRSEVEQISVIVPHIQRACRLSLAVAAAAAAGIMAGLDHVDRAAILLDDMGLVFKMNAAAERLMGHGVTISNRKLHGSRRDGDRLLQRLIAIAAANKPPHESPALDAAAIPRRKGRPLVVQGAPLVNSARDLFQQARAILIIRDLDHRMEPDDFLLRGIVRVDACRDQAGEGHRPDLIRASAARPYDRAGTGEKDPRSYITDFLREAIMNKLIFVALPILLLGSPALSATYNVDGWATGLAQDVEFSEDTPDSAYGAAQGATFVASAMNLNGGSASVFVSEGISDVPDYNGDATLHYYGLDGRALADVMYMIRVSGPVTGALVPVHIMMTASAASLDVPPPVGGPDGY